MFQIKVVEKVKTRILCSTNFLWKLCCSWDTWKNIIARQATKDNIIGIMCFACWLAKTRTQWEYVILFCNRGYMNLPQCYIIHALNISLQSVIRSSNLSSLPDRGTRLQMVLTEKQTKLKKLKEQWQSSNFDAVPGKCILLKTKF
jgi:hypothetical protein